MGEVIDQYGVKCDNRNRITLRDPRCEYYHATEYADGRVLLEPRELISRRTWNNIDDGIRNLERGQVGDEFDFNELQDLLNEP